MNSIILLFYSAKVCFFPCQCHTNKLVYPLAALVFHVIAVDVQQVDMDNKTKLSNVAVLKKRGANEIVVYPNPVTDNFTVKLGQPSKNKTELKLTDLSGRTVKSWAFSNSNTLLTVDLKNTGIASGNYMLSIFQDNVLVRSMAIRKK